MGLINIIDLSARTDQYEDLFYDSIAPEVNSDCSFGDDASFRKCWGGTIGDPRIDSASD